MSPIQYQTVNALAGKTISPIGVPLHVPRRFQRPQQHGFEVSIVKLTKKFKSTNISNFLKIALILPLKVDYMC